MTGHDGPCEDGEEQSATVLCANCGTSIDTHEWHPVVGENGDDGEFRLYPFCDETCRNK